MHYIDTSVLAAYYFPEQRTENVTKVLRKVQGPTISPLVEVELYCAIARRVRSKVLNTDAARQIHSRFQLHISEGVLRMVDIGAPEYTMARDWLSRLETPLRVLDALHLAAAFTNELTLITADKDLAVVARHFKVKCKFVP